MTRKLPHLVCLISALTCSYSSAKSAYQHSPTGIILPPQIEGLKLGKVHKYENTALGESVSYNSDSATASIYIYNFNQDEIVDTPEHTHSIAEIKNTLNGINQAEEKGYYSNVKHDDKIQCTTKAQSFNFLSTTSTYQTVKSKSADSVESYTGVGIYNNYFIKVRYSFNLSEKNEELRDSRDKFEKTFLNLVAETKVRESVRTALKTYFSNPFSEESKQAGALIVSYAEASELVTITVNHGNLPWLGDEDYSYGSSLLVAYVVGQVNAQLGSKNFENHEAAGLKQMLTIYKQLKEKYPKAHHPSMEKMVTESKDN